MIPAPFGLPIDPVTGSADAVPPLLLGLLPLAGFALTGVVLALVAALHAAWNLTGSSPPA